MAFLLSDGAAYIAGPDHLRGWRLHRSTTGCRSTLRRRERHPAGRAHALWSTRSASNPIFTSDDNAFFVPVSLICTV